jgi:hypothetical protein
MLMIYQQIAVQRSIAVVVINQMTTKFDHNSSGSDEAKLAPALGKPQIITYMLLDSSYTIVPVVIAVLYAT